MARLLSRLLWGATWVALLFFLLFFAFRSLSILGFPYQVEYGEGPVLGWTQQLAMGQWPYKPFAAFPWSFSVYTPGYLAASALLARLLPLTTPLWFGGRLLSLLSALGLALLIPLAVRSRGAGLLALLWLATPYLFRWATFFRPDLFALLWSAVGLVLLQRALARDERRLLLVAVLCLVLAFFSKQSFFAAPLAGLFYLARQRRAWLPLYVGSGALAGLLCGSLLSWASGGAMLDNLILANANPFSWSALWHFERAFFQTVPLLALLALWRIWQRPGGLFALYALLSLLVTISVGKAGAWENYFLEPLWAFCVLAAQALPALPARERLLPALLLLQLALFLPGYERWDPRAERAWLAEMAAEGAALHAALAPLPPGALIWSEQMGLLAEQRRPIPLHSFVYTQLARQGLWEEEALLHRLRAGEGALLIQRWDAVADPLGRDRWSRAMLDAAEQGFALGERAGRWRLRPPLPFPKAESDPQPLNERIQLRAWMVRDHRVPVALEAGERLSIHLLWQAQQAEAIPLSSSVQLFAPDGERVAQHDAPLRCAGLGGAWPAGALVRDEHELSLPDRLPPGPYTLQLSLYESESGRVRGTLSLGRLKVSPPPPTGRVAQPSAVRFGGALRLLGHDRLPTTLDAGTMLTLRARWQALGSLERPLTSFLHLVGPEGTLVAQHDLAPAYPVTVWSAGEAVELLYSLVIPDSLPPGDYRLYLGWYEAESFQRLPLTGGSDALELGQLRVR